MPAVNLMPAALRRQLHRQVMAALSHDRPAPDYDAPVGDPGLFGPGSVTWKIHADFPGMMTGGLAALMLQTLHPLALAGVWDHSDFRGDMLGRLRNTTAFVARTTYAPRAPAVEAIRRVARIHQKVSGTLPDGRSYRADDPHLLNWVHCAESWCFLEAYETYCHKPIPRAMQDDYLQETAVIAEALGARDVPESLDELDGFLGDIRGELEFNARTREVLGALESINLPIPFSALNRNVFLGAGAALLPNWAVRLMGRPLHKRMLDQTAGRAMKIAAPSIRDVMAEGGLAWRACTRTGTDYEALFRWPDAPS